MCAGRRRLFSTAVATIGMAQLGIVTSTHAQASETDVERHSATRLRTMRYSERSDECMEC
jgi:hypothetical protein